MKRNEQLDDLSQTLHILEQSIPYVKSLITTTRTEEKTLYAALERLVMLAEDVQSISADIEMTIIVNNIEKSLHKPNLEVVR